MFGAFRPTSSLSGGLLWKIPWRMSKHQKARARKRLKNVDNVIATVDRALARSVFRTSPSSSLPSSTSSNPFPETPVTTLSSSSYQNTPHTTGTADDSTSSIATQPTNPTLNTPNTYAEIRALEKAAAAGRPKAEFKPHTIKALDRWKAEMPTEEEMLPRDKYTMFDRKARGYRKGLHKLPKWTRVSQRLNPPGY